VREKAPKAKDNKVNKKLILGQNKHDSPAPPPVVDGQKRLTAITKRGPGRPRGGFKKEKTQISVRIDQAVMDLAYELIEEEKGLIRITELIERGIVLAMRERKKLIPLDRQTRFLVSEASTPQLKIMRGSLSWDLTPEPDEVPTLEQFTLIWKSMREFFLTVANFPEALSGCERRLNSMVYQLKGPANEYDPK
jgi:hypothetical protein